MDRKEFKEVILEIISEVSKKTTLKPEELGEGVPTEIYFDRDNYLVLKNNPGQMVFLHPSQVIQLHNFLMKNKIKAK